MIEKTINMAEQAGEIILKYYKKDYEIKAKSDFRGDVVTKADHEADEFIRKELSKQFPNDEILSEEHHPNEANFSKRVWIVDPLDGTYIFTLERDSFGVLIGLCEGGVPTLGVMHFPALEETFYAEKGEGAFIRKNGQDKKLEVSSRAGDDAILKGKKPYDQLKYFKNVVKAVKPSNVLDPGDCCTAKNIADICTGKADFTFFSSAYQKEWDTCATQIILEESGGKVTNFKGQKLDYSANHFSFGEDVLASNGSVHEEILRKISNSRDSS